MLLATYRLTSLSPSGGALSPPPAHLAADAAPVPPPASAAPSSPIPDPCPPIPDFLDRGWLGLTAPELIARVRAALAETARRQDRTARALRRAVARHGAWTLQRDRKRKARIARARRAASKAQQKGEGHA